MIQNFAIKSKGCLPQDLTLAIRQRLPALRFQQPERPGQSTIAAAVPLINLLRS
jgi:hypothetical protein